MGLSIKRWDTLTYVLKRSAGHHIAALQVDNEVCCSNRRQPVRDNDCGHVSGQVLDRPRDGLLGLGVE